MKLLSFNYRREGFRGAVVGDGVVDLGASCPSMRTWRTTSPAATTEGGRHVAGRNADVKLSAIRSCR